MSRPKTQSLVARFFSFLFFILSHLPTHFRCRGLFLGRGRNKWHTHTHTHTLGRIPLDEWSARRRDLYLTKHNTHKRQIFVQPAVFEPAFPASERPQTHVLDGAATGIGSVFMIWHDNCSKLYSEYHSSPLVLSAGSLTVFTTVNTVHWLLQLC